MSRRRSCSCGMRGAGEENEYSHITVPWSSVVKKNAIIAFYSPGCSHCVDMYPEFAKLVASKIPGITISAVNATTINFIKGVPAVWFYDSSGQKHVFNGDRKLNEFKKFIASHHKISGGKRSIHNRKSSSPRSRVYPTRHRYALRSRSRSRIRVH